MAEPLPDSPRLRSRGDGTVGMVVGVVVAALMAYLFQLVGGRALGKIEFEPIAQLWTIHFLAFAIVLLPIEQLTIRRLAISPSHPLRQDLPLLAGTVGVAAVAVSVVLYAGRDQLLSGEGVHALQAGLIVLGYGVFAFGRGRLAGSMQYRNYGFATAGESTLRFIVLLAVLAAAPRSVPVGWAMVTGFLVIFAWRPFRIVRDDEPHTAPSAAKFLGSYVVANGASNIVLAAGPIVVKAMDAAPGVSSVFFFTLILMRAPLTLGYSLVARILHPMSRAVAEGHGRALHVWGRRIVVFGLIMAAAGYGVGRVLGPVAVELLFGAEFRPSSALAGLIVAGVAASMASLAATQILVARGHTGFLAVAWVVALAAAALAIVVASGDPDIRVGVGFLVGQVTALSAISVAVFSSGRPAL
ncbi:MAG: hypothetical protein OEM22_00765 [Acidimicrobiia bacterium]|nr:hypothetical protein [Acidimicrobiia bacterium]MDH3470161.1 hypothetical protein [Acidimicrobiia bacterium]